MYYQPALQRLNTGSVWYKNSHIMQGQMLDSQTLPSQLSWWSSTFLYVFFYFQCVWKLGCL